MDISRRLLAWLCRRPPPLRFFGACLSHMFQLLPAVLTCLRTLRVDLPAPGFASTTGTAATLGQSRSLSPPRAQLVHSRVVAGAIGHFLSTTNAATPVLAPAGGSLVLTVRYRLPEALVEVVRVQGVRQGGRLPAKNRERRR